jgi:pyruvate dehydrogenase E1 component
MDSQEQRTLETREWLDSLDAVLQTDGPARVLDLLRDLSDHATARGVRQPFTANTPYINTIHVSDQPVYPGNRDIERRIKSLVRWNAMAMVVRANQSPEESIGGHISTYASAATLYEVGFNHFFHGKGSNAPDIIYFQGHASPGIYARAFLEGRLSAEQLGNFRRELAPGGGLSSYPHPWLMPEFWEHPTVSMGLGPINAIYRARFIRYLEDRGLAAPTQTKVWAFLGDGETDEPESLGAITLASRERLDNLIFVINCNLQRLDGPVRGNGSIIQELEAVFRGAGWNVVKVIWGSEWDALLEQDTEGLLRQRMGEIVDGEYQRYAVESGAYVRKHFWGAHPSLLAMVDHLGDEQLKTLSLGGHDPAKVYAAYKAAVGHAGQPTVILARTVKGYGLGEAGEGKNITHQQKKLNDDELRAFRDRFCVPLSDADVLGAPFYRPADASTDMKYMRERRQLLGGFVPTRHVTVQPVAATDMPAVFDEFNEGSGGRKVSTTMAFVRMLAKLLRDPNIGKLIVPIVPDEARTFGMEALFRQVGIYSHIGQQYEPVDHETLLYYREATDGQILEEGINEAGAMSSFIAAGTGYTSHAVNTIPFFIYYSMFGMQRIGDLVWAAADARARGFLLGATAGRTTLAGEGLQHCDGHSHLLSLAVPSLVSYDPAFAYEIGVIIQDGMRRMYQDGESVFFYLTLMNEQYEMPPMPEGVRDGILKGMYLFRPADATKGAGGSRPRAQLLGSGAILPEVLKAQALLGERYGVTADVWSVTSYQELYREAHTVDRWNRLHPAEAARVPYAVQCLGATDGVIVAASDYVTALPDLVGRWLPGRFTSLGTDGFGRSESRAALRDFFEVDSKAIVIATLTALARAGDVPPGVAQTAINDVGIDPERPNPATMEA